MRLYIISEDTTLDSLFKWVEMIQDDPTLDDIITIFSIAKKNFKDEELSVMLSDIYPSIQQMHAKLSDEDNEKFKRYYSKVSDNGKFQYSGAYYGWLPTMTGRLKWQFETQLEEAMYKIMSGEWPTNRAALTILEKNQQLLDKIDPTLLKNYTDHIKQYLGDSIQQTSLAQAIIQSASQDQEYIKDTIIDTARENPNGLTNDHLVKHVYIKLKTSNTQESLKTLPRLIQKIILILVKESILIKTDNNLLILNN